MRSLGWLCFVAALLGLLFCTAALAGGLLGCVDWIDRAAVPLACLSGLSLAGVFAFALSVIDLGGVAGLIGLAGSFCMDGFRGLLGLAGAWICGFGRVFAFVFLQLT